MAAFIALVERETSPHTDPPKPGPSGYSKPPPKETRTQPGSGANSPPTRARRAYVRALEAAR
ncbi:hypothetical protein [Streptomyces armeniacus]|uniref:hypothetical protein n=1 Tax=Streptomyces armeniacus TaxID=83291 RepID=UPI001AD827D3|nr:hypothetical protein [Streptomyces armeniacus]